MMAKCTCHCEVIHLQNSFDSFISFVISKLHNCSFPVIVTIRSHLRIPVPLFNSDIYFFYAFFNVRFRQSKNASVSTSLLADVGVYVWIIVTFLGKTSSLILIIRLLTGSHSITADTSLWARKPNPFMLSGMVKLIKKRDIVGLTTRVLELVAAEGLNSLSASNDTLCLQLSLVPQHSAEVHHLRWFFCTSIIMEKTTP